MTKKSKKLNFFKSILCGDLWFTNNNTELDYTKTDKGDHNLPENQLFNIHKSSDSNSIKREIERENRINNIKVKNNILRKTNNKISHNHKDSHNYKNPNSISNTNTSDTITNNLNTVSNLNTVLQSEYVPLILENININSLYIKHKILLKYIDIDNNLYIKSIVLKKSKEEIGCFNNGENKKVIFRAKSDSLLQITAIEHNDREESIFVVNGKFVI